MGYMGFGMRKEVYTRKPKEAFKKLKQVHGEIPKNEKGLSDADYKALKGLRKYRFLHFYQSRVFRVLSLIVIASITFGTVWYLELGEYYKKYQQAKFDEEGIVQYFNSNEAKLNTVYSFFSTRRNKIVSVYRGFLDYQVLNLKSIDLSHKFHVDSVNRINYFTDWTDKKCTINNNKLTVSGKGFIAKTYNDSWLLEITFSNGKPTNATVLKYLNTDWNELKKILKILKTNDWTISTNENHISLHYKHPEFNNYNIIFSDYPPNQLPEEWQIKGYNVKSGTIKEGKVYWTRLEEIPS